MYTVLKWSIAVILFLTVIIIHEFGHFIFAKMNKIKVNEFAIGMGPKLFGIQGKETLYTFRLLPIGGYCAMEGEDEESDAPNSFCSKKVWQRFSVVFAGAFFNLILGLIFMIIVQAQTEVYTTAKIAKFTENAPSQSAGLKVGDRVIKINDYKILNSSDMSFAMQMDEDGVMDYTVIRDGKKVLIKDIKFNRIKTEYGEATQFDYFVYGEKRTFLNVIKYSFSETVSMCRMVYKSIGMLFSGGAKLTDLAGPVGTAGAIGQAADIGFQKSFISGFNNILSMMALITVNLGIFNLLPLPALDGGRIVFLLIEFIRRKPVNPKYEGWVHAAGLALLVGLMLVVTFNDITKLIKG